MIFHSFVYAIFLPVVLLAHLALPRRGRHILLLTSSYVFYCWVEPSWGLLMLASTLLDYTCGRLMGRVASPHARRFVLAASVAGNLGILGYFKYVNFFAANVAALLRLCGWDIYWSALEIILPAGISFYTFQTMAYTIQVYRRQIPVCRDLLSFGVYVSFFPQLVAGPIERASNLLPQLSRPPRVTWDDIGAGLTRIVLGLFRKLVLADRFALIVNRVFADPDSQPTAAIWMAVFAFMAQITFDFSAYSDIAIGSARLFGIRLTENFRRPMMSASQAEFWARWHITLTSWLRDYLFVPLGGFRKGWKRALLNGWIVLLLCGLWHGASWNFVVWGAAEALCISIYYFWRAFAKRRGWSGGRDAKRLTWRRLLSWILTVVTNTLLCGICFRSPTLATMGRMARGLVGAHGGAGMPAHWDVAVFAWLLAICMGVELLQEYAGLNGRVRRLPVTLRAALLAGVAALTAILAVNNSSPYMYFQF